MSFAGEMSRRHDAQDYALEKLMNRMLKMEERLMSKQEELDAAVAAVDSKATALVSIVGTVAGDIKTILQELTDAQEAAVTPDPAVGAAIDKLSVVSGNLDSAIVSLDAADASTKPPAPVAPPAV